MHVAALRRLFVPSLVVIAALVLLAISSGDSKAQWVPGTPQFDPIFDVKLCNDLKPGFSGPAVLQGGGGTCAPNNALSGNPDITIAYLVPQGHLNYDQSYYVSYGGASETRVAGPVGGGPNGDGTGLPAGGLESRTTLGLASNPCSNTIYPDFIWWDAETNTADTVACQSEGTSDRWSNMASDGGDAYAGQADANSPIVTSIPDCLLKVFDPDGSGDASGGYSPVAPNWRGAGLTQVPPGGDWQMLNNFEFAPGALQAAFSSNPGSTNHPFAKLTPDIGYTNVIILNDPTTVVLQPNPISDFCTVLGTRGMIKGVVGAVNRITSPGSAGSYLAGSRTMSYRDADGDGIENNFDTCAWAANTAAEDPYVNSGPDTDMLDSACDPTPAAKVDDQDGDGYLNSQDWCPLAANPLPGGETDSENSVARNTGAPDGGPPQDAIGDDCDSENGGNDTVSDGDYFNVMYVDSVCVGGTDNDQDGWCAAEDNNDTDSYNPAAAEDGIAAACANGIDDGELPGGQPPDGLVDRWDPDCNPNVKDTGGTFSNRMPDSSDPDGDDDSSGVGQYQLSTSNEEWRVGTDPLNSCPLIKGHDTWPPDFNADGVSNILDIVQLTPPVFNSNPGNPNFVTRKDLNGDNTINILDIVQLTPPVFNTSCPP